MALDVSGGPELLVTPSPSAGRIANSVGIGSGILASLGSAIALSIARGKKQDVGISIMGVGPNGNVLIPQQAFQWWPETLTDSIGVGWNAKQIPGSSHDVMQWGGNAGRTIAFSIKLSRTMRNQSDFQSNRVPASARGLNTESPTNLTHNVNISAMLKYLRAYCYPSYTQGNATPPVRAVLHVPGMALNEDGSDHLIAVMTACDHSYVRCWEDGSPRLVEVSLAFKQVVQDSNGVHWKSRQDVLLGIEQSGIRTGSARNNFPLLAIPVTAIPGDVQTPPTP